MKLHNTVNAPAVYGNGVSNLGEFKIRASAKAFNILSSGLYANKIKAIVREIGCNAVDSHVAAGKADVQFDVHLPSMLEPYFYIRDYGTGLSHDDVTKIYTTYFESTKTDSNDYIGALGLGSKSPFSYTDNFTITAIKNGRKGIYSAFISESGFPSIMQMAEHDTNEPTGVEVRFSVNDYADFRKFADEAVETYRWFKLKPNILNNDDVNDRVKISVDYDLRDLIPGVHVYTQNNLYTAGLSYALMGNIAYPIEDTHFKVNDDSGVNYKSLLNCNLVLEFKIGELDFQASREGLSYIPLTIESIKSKLRELSANLESVFAAEMNVYPKEDVFSRAKIVGKHTKTKLMHNVVSIFLEKEYNYNSNLGQYSTFCEQTNPYLLQSNSLNMHLREEDVAKFNIRVTEYEVHYRNRSKVKLQVNSPRAYKKIAPPAGTTQPATFLMQNEIRIATMPNYTTSSGRYKYDDSVENLGVGLENNIQFVVHDKNNDFSHRIRTHVHIEHENGQNRILEKWIALQPIDDTKSMDLDEFFKFVRNPSKKNVIESKDLKKKVSLSSGVKRKRSIDAYPLEFKQNRYNDYFVFNYKNRVKIDDIKEPIKWYLPLENGAIVGGGWTCGISEFIPHVLRADPNIKERNIFGLNKTCVKAIADDKTWVNLYDYIKNLVLNISEDEIKTATNFLVFKDEISNTCYSHILKYNSENGNAKINPNSPVLSLQKYWDSSSARDVHQKVDACQKLLQCVGLEENKNPLSDLAGDESRNFFQVKNKYNLLRLLSPYQGFNSVDVLHMIGYINTVDSEV
jgi:hypothetical protein